MLKKVKLILQIFLYAYMIAIPILYFYQFEDLIVRIFNFLMNYMR